MESSGRISWLTPQFIGNHHRGFRVGWKRKKGPRTYGDDQLSGSSVLLRNTKCGQRPEARQLALVDITMLSVTQERVKIDNV